MVNFKTTQKGIENGNMQYSNQQQKIKKIEHNNALKQVRIEKTSNVRKRATTTQLNHRGVKIREVYLKRGKIKRF